MATLLDQAKLSRESEFRWRVCQAMVNQAVAVSTETKPDYRRGNYAAQVLNNSDYYVPHFSYAIAAQINKATVTDAEIISAMSFVWNAFASAFDKNEPKVEPTNVEPKAGPPVVVAPEPEPEPEPEEAEEEEAEEQPESKPWYKKLFGG